MIEVSAKLLGDPVYFSGKKVSCLISFKRVQEDLCPNNNTDVLGWASAQVVCICSINPQKVQGIGNMKASNSLQHTKNNYTSLTPSRGEQGSVIYSSNPKILVCDLNLTGDNSIEFVYEENLPESLPPSFRGQAVKYSYKLKIGLQRVGASVKLLHVPLRLMNWQSLGVPYCLEQQDLVVSNPFMKLNKASLQSENDEAFETLQLLTSRRSPSVFKVTNSKGKVVSLCLFKTGFRLGEDIIGTLDFTDTQVPCMQYSVTLQSKEIVSEEKKQSLSISKVADDSTVTSYTKHHEFCVGLLQTHITLPIPLHVTPSFESELVSLQWRLHFEFVTTISPLSWEVQSEWKPPGIIDIETMVWDLPVTVYPTTPAHICKGLHAGNNHASLII